MKSTSIAIGSIVFLAACGGDATTTHEPSSAPPSASAPTPQPQASITAAPSASSAPTAPPAQTAAWHTAGFQTPESVLYDDAGDRFLVTNINGKPLDADNNGYISEVSPDGKVTNEKLIEGGKNKVTLNAPKGTAIANGVLYVADIDTVRTFDLKTLAPKGDIKVAGATFLNDVAAGPDGKVYVTDSGLKAGAKDFEPTGTDAVYVIEKNQAKAIAKSKDLNRPNGVFIGDKGAIFVNTFGSNEVYRLDDKGAKQDVTKTPKGGLDGLALMGDTIWASSWEASAVYKGKVGGTLDVVISNVKSPADFGYDKKRNRIVVPLFTENVVEAYDVK
jgi:sugar lactone lactonase YvrE